MDNSRKPSTSEEFRQSLTGRQEFRAAITFDQAERRADGSMTIRGYSAVFDADSEPIYGMFIERIARGAFRKVLASKPDVRFLVNHAGLAFARTVNGTLRLKEDNRGLLMEADLNPADAEAVSLFTKIERGDVDQQSFAFTVARDEWSYDCPDDGCSLDHRTILEFGSLLEVSVVTFPAYPATDVSASRNGCEAGEQRDTEGDETQHGIGGAPATSADQPSVSTPNLARAARINALVDEFRNQRNRHMSIALKEARDAALAKLDALAVIAEERALTEDENKQIEDIKAEIKDIDHRWNVADAATELRASGREASPAPVADVRSAATPPSAPEARRVSVTEASPYAKTGATRSFFADLKLSALGDTQAREILQGVAREERALTSTDANGGYLVAPLWMQNEFVELRAKGAVTANVVNNLELPAHTDSINLPTMNGATTVALSTENSALDETSATFSTVAASVYRVGGQQKIPNTLIDRSMPAIDQIILRDLAKRAALKVNGYVLAGAGTTEPLGITATASINTTTHTQGTATPQQLYAKLVAQATNIATTNFDTDGLVYIMHGRRWGWYLAQVESSTGRPFITALAPQNNPAVAAGFPSEGLVGYTSTGHPVYVDNNITVTNGAATDEDQIICMVAAEQYLFNGTPKFAVSTDAAFSSDQTVVRVTQDMAFTAGRRPKSIDVMSGTGLNDTI